MRSFLVKNKKPVCKWGRQKDGVLFEGKVPEGYKLAISPTPGYIIVDVDFSIKNNKNGFLYLPEYLKESFAKTLNYATKSGGRHYWFRYTGDVPLINKSTKMGIDLRTEKGYVVWYREDSIKDCIEMIQDSDEKVNHFLIKYFS